MTDSSGAFCPACGAAVDPTAGRGQAGTRREQALCDACYFDRFDLVDAPESVAITVCGTCGAVSDGDTWEDNTDPTSVAIDAVTDQLGVHADATDLTWSVDPEQVDATTLRLHCRFNGIVRDTHLEDEVTVPVSIGGGTCPRCGRIAGDYYAATVQVRATGRTPTTSEVDRAVTIARDAVADRTEDGDRDAFISEVDRTADGVDIKLSDTQLARAVATSIQADLGGSLTDTRTLVTEDQDGNEVYRSTYAVRLPRYTPGDIIDPGDGDGPVLIRSVAGNLKGVRLTTGDTYEATADPDTARSLGSRTDAEETTLVAVIDEHAVQVLDPDTADTTTVPRPSYLDSEMDTVTVLKSRAGLHILPPE
ncbi:MAG: 60S ribosomal export protein NMD3 [Halobacteriaceae archaeon]